MENQEAQKTFMSFIEKKPQTRLSGFTTALIIGLSLMVFFLWKQHLVTDSQIVKNMQTQLESVSKDRDDYKSKYLHAVDHFVEYSDKVTKRNDSIAYYNQRFIKELKTIK